MQRLVTLFQVQGKQSMKKKKRIKEIKKNKRRIVLKFRIICISDDKTKTNKSNMERNLQFIKFIVLFKKDLEKVGQS